MKHFTPREAYAYLQRHPEALFVDCRSEAEFFLVGHPIVMVDGSVVKRPEHVLWADELALMENPNFVADVERLLSASLADLNAQRTHDPRPGAPGSAVQGQQGQQGQKDHPILVMCRSGRRSVFAAGALEAAGYREVINVLEGFEGPLNDRDHRSAISGWRFDGLPWEQL